MKGLAMRTDNLICMVIFWKKRVPMLTSHGFDGMSCDYIEGRGPPNYPMPTTLLKAYDESETLLDLRDTYWQPNN